MKYIIIIGVGAAIGITFGFITSSTEFRGKRELLVPAFYPEGVPDTLDDTTYSSDSAKVKVVNGETYEFGTMERDETKQHVFIFKNEGTVPLTIHLLNTTCKCTLSEIEDTEIAPGETTEVLLEWKPENYAINFSQVARIKTNDPRRDVIDLRIEGRVIQPVWSSPEQLVVSPIFSKDGFDSVVHIFSSEESFAIEELIFEETNYDEKFIGNFERLAEDDEMLELQSAKVGYALRIQAEPGLPLEPIMQNLFVKTSLSAVEDLEIPIRGNVKGDISFGRVTSYPMDNMLNLLNVGLLTSAGSTTVELPLLIRGENAESINVWIDEDGVSPAGSLRATISGTRDLGGAKQARVLIEFPHLAEPVNKMGPERDNFGRIEIHTDHPIDKLIVLYVKFAIAG